MGVGKPNLLHLRKLIINYDVLIEKNVLKEIKKFPVHDVNRIKKGRVGGAVGAQPGTWGCVQAGAVTTG